MDPFHRPLGGADTPYLEQGVQIEEDILRDGDGFAVMMPWETPLMVCISLRETVGMHRHMLKSFISTRSPDVGESPSLMVCMVYVLAITHRIYRMRMPHTSAVVALPPC